MDWRDPIRFHRPAGRLTAARALIIVLHGGGGSGGRLRTWFGMDAIAEREGFAVAYPDGLGGHWNDGREEFHERRAAGKRPVDDVAFLVGLARTLNGRGLASPATTFVTGVSNGGMMTFRLACETEGVFAGFATGLPTYRSSSQTPAGRRGRGRCS